jgi:hypothetical protein
VVQPASGQPPKQRWIPFESRLQTSFLPLQQFQDVVSPQLFPGGLQAVPPLHR